VTTALVLGGGGPLGIAWQAGLLTGIGRRGIDLSRADLVLGTSAGSVVGAALATGGDLTALPQQVSGPLPAASASATELGLAMALAAQITDPATAVERAIAYALGAATVEEADFLGLPLFTAFFGTPWPAAFRCTAIDTRAQRLHVWDAAAGVGLPPALAASCAVPGLFPPITVQDSRYLDGGVLSVLNATLAAGHQHVIAVSCLPLTAHDTTGKPTPTAQRQLAEIDQLRAGGSEVVLIEPGLEFLTISEWGADVMNTARAADAYEAGLHQADDTLFRRLSATGQQ